MYGESLTNSVSRLERYAACAYAHFLSYGLQLEARQQYQLSIPDIGNIFHSSMELFSNKLNSSQFDWSSLTEEARNELVHEAVEEATMSYNNTILLSSKRNEYMIQRVERITRRTVWALCEHVKSGDFIPKGFELQFSRLDHLNNVNVELEDGSKMLLQGRIDRVDTKEEDEQVYVRVVDYKSGSTTLDLGKLYHGLQLQLVVYLNAAVELEQQQAPEKVVIPAGIFYYNINDPLVEKQLDKFKAMHAAAHRKEEDGSATHSPEWIESVNEELLKELKLNGIVNEQKDIIMAMDHSFINEDDDTMMKGSTKSKVIPVDTTKDGSPSKRSSVASNAEFKTLCNYVMDKVKEFGNEIVDGDIRLEPYKLGNSTACDYCDYKSVCGFDQKLPGNTYRKLVKLKSDDVWEKLKEVEEDE